MVNSLSISLEYRTYNNVEGSPIIIIFHVHNRHGTGSMPLQLPHQQVHVSLHNTLLVLKRLQTKRWDKGLPHARMVLLQRIDQRKYPIGSWLRPDRVLGEFPMALLAMPIDVEPGLGIDEGQFIGRQAHNLAVSVVETLSVVHQMPRLKRPGKRPAEDGP
jgi:hypothetical protein